MTQEEKQLLLRDLCTRSPYGVMCFAPDYEYGDIGKLWSVDPFEDLDPEIYILYPKGNTISKFCSEVKPYLRPMSSMTEDEQRTLDSMCNGVEMVSRLSGLKMFDKAFDWLNQHHFDYRGLIDKGLALEAPEGMYKTE